MFYDFLCRRTGLDPRDKKKKADVKDIELKISSTSFVEVLFKIIYSFMVILDYKNLMKADY